MRRQLVCSSSSAVAGPSSASLLLAVQCANVSQFNTDKTHMQKIEQKSIAFDYSKHHKTRRHHSYTNTKTLWSDAARQHLTDDQLPILSRIHMNEEAARDAAMNAKVLREYREGKASNSTSGGANNNNNQKSAEERAAKYRLQPSTNVPTAAAATATDAANSSSSPSPSSSSAAPRVLINATNGLSNARKNMRSAVANLVKCQQWKLSVPRRDAAVSKGQEEVLDALIAESRAAELLVKVVHSLNKRGQVNLKQKGGTSSDGEQPAAPSTTTPTTTATSDDAPSASASAAPIHFDVPVGTIEVELHAVTTRLLGCVLALEAAEHLTAVAQQEAFARSGASGKKKGVSAVKQLTYQKRQQVEAATTTLLLLAKLSADAIVSFFMLQETIDLESQFDDNVPSQRAMAKAVEKLLLQSSVFAAYVLTDPIVTKARDLLAMRHPHQQQHHAPQLPAAANNNNASSSAPAAPATPSPPPMMMMSRADRALAATLDAITLKADDHVAALLSSVGEIVHETVLGESLTVSGAAGDEDRTLDPPPKLNAREMAIAAKAAVIFADTTETMDGNEFYASVLSPLQNGLAKEIKNMTRIIESNLKISTDNFGKTRRSMLPKDFPINFAKIRHLLECGRSLSMVTEKHFAHADPSVLTSAHSAVRSRLRVEEAIVQMLAVTPNIVISGESVAVQRWLGAIGVEGMLTNSNSSSNRKSSDSSGNSKKKKSSAAAVPQSVLVAAKIEQKRFDRNRSDALLLFQRATMFAPEDAVIGGKSKIEMLAKLMEMYSSGSSGDVIAALPNDERNWWSQSVRNIVKGLGKAEKHLSVDVPSPSSAAEGDAAAAALVMTERTLANATLFMEACEAIRHAPLELWQSMAHTLVRIADRPRSAAAPFAAAAEGAEEEVASLAARLLDMTLPNGGAAASEDGDGSSHADSFVNGVDTQSDIYKKLTAIAAPNSDTEAEGRDGAAEGH